MRQQLKNTETLEAPIDQSNCYSVIIGNLNPEFKLVDALQNKIYRYDGNGKIQTSEKGTPFSVYATEADYKDNDIRLKPTFALATPLKIYNELEDNQKEIANVMKNFLNNAPCAAFWHSGDLDDRCEYNGMHMHVIVHCNYKLAEMPRYRQLVSNAKKFGYLVKYQRVKYLYNILAHMQTPPRVLLICNNMKMCSHMIASYDRTNKQKTMDQFMEEKETVEDVKEDPPASYFMSSFAQANKTTDRSEKNYTQTNSVSDQIKKMSENKQGFVESTTSTTTFRTKLIERVYQVKTHIKRWGKNSPKEILTEIMKKNDVEALDEWRSLATSQYFGKIWMQALDEISIEEELLGYTYITKYIEECPYQEMTMDTATTADTYIRWCKEQGIHSGDLALSIYATLAMSYPKKNTLAMMGASNAGKTYWATSFMPFTEDIGQTVVSSDFTYQKCVNKRLIHIPELTLTKPEHIEESKKIFEGQQTMVNVKNKEPVWLKRTPVILTSNQTPWRNFAGEHEAFKNRMFMFPYLKESDVLKDAGSPDPRFWQQVFHYINEKLWNKEIPEDNQDLMWEGDALAVEGKITELANQHKKRLEKTWRDEYKVERIPMTRRRFAMKDTDMMGTTQEEKLQWVKEYLDIVTRPDADDYSWNLGADGSPMLMVHGEIYPNGMEIPAMTLNSIKDNCSQLTDVLSHLGEWPSQPIYTKMQKNLPALYKVLLNEMFVRCFDTYSRESKKRRMPDDVIEVLSQCVSNNPPMYTSTPKRKYENPEEPNAPKRARMARAVLGRCSPISPERTPTGKRFKRIRQLSFSSSEEEEEQEVKKSKADDTTESVLCTLNDFKNAPLV